MNFIISHHYFSFFKTFCVTVLFAILSFSIFGDVFADAAIPFNAEDAGLYADDENAYNPITEGAIDPGVERIVNLLTTVFWYMKVLLGIFVIAFIVYAGLQIIASGGKEDQVESSKKIVLYGVSGLVVMLLIEPLVLDIFVGGRGITFRGGVVDDMLTAQDNFRIQLDGVIQFFKTILILLAMAYVINAGVRLIFAFGSDDQLSSAKGMFLPIVFGILIILFNEVFIDFVLYDIAFDGDPSEDHVDFSPDGSEAAIFVEQLVGFVQYILQFLGLLLFGFLVYGGLLYIISFGNEESANKGKDIFINAAIGMFILIFAYILMWSLVNFSIG